MITEPQLTEIRNYLLSKKLPIDILIEVNDHFISQISDLQRDENLSFEDAFEKVKLKWGGDFILVRKNFFSSKKIPKIAYEIDLQQNKKLFLKSIYLVFIFTFFEIISARFLSESIYTSVMSITLFFFLLYPFKMLFMYVKQQKLLFKNRRKNVVVNNFLHPLLSFAIGFTIDQMSNFPKTRKHLIYDFMNFGEDANINTEIFSLNLICGIIVLTFYVYAFLSINKNIKKLEKLNNFQLK